MAVFHLWKRKIEFCSVCKTQLKHKYKPSKDWNIQGFLCGDCHTSKTKEFVIKQQEEKERQEKEANRCSICGLDIGIDSKKFKPRWQWNMNKDRKSTRLNSSHQAISYAVFCLKKKKKK